MGAPGKVMSRFDDLFSAFGAPMLFAWNGRQAYFTYTSADRQTQTTDLDCIVRNQRWEIIETDTGENVQLTQDVSFKNEDLPELQAKSVLTDPDGREWVMERVISEANSLIWWECTHVEALEHASGNFRRLA